MFKRLHANRGTVLVGASHDTPAFAVDCIETWWRTEGRKRYPQATEINILADAGGSNGCSRRALPATRSNALGTGP